MDGKWEQKVSATIEWVGPGLVPQDWGNPSSSFVCVAVLAAPTSLAGGCQGLTLERVGLALRDSLISMPHCMQVSTGGKQACRFVNMP